MSSVEIAVCRYFNDLGIIKLSFSGETAEEIYDSLYIGEHDKPQKEEFLLKVVEKQNEYFMELLREQRTKLLSECDWTQMSDVVVSNKEEWKTYRQALRDLPSNANPTSEDMSGLFPSKPE